MKNGCCVILARRESFFKKDLVQAERRKNKEYFRIEIWDVSLIYRKCP